MAQISSITLPNGNEYGLKGSIYTVIGTQVAATGTWIGELETIDALYDGLTIAYYLPWAGNGNATLNLTLKNDIPTGPINCYYKGNTRLTTHYDAGDIILMTYWSAGSISISGVATADDRWIAHGQYDVNNLFTALSLGFGYGVCNTEANVATKTVSINSNTLGSNGSIISVKFINGNTVANPTLNINNEGAKNIFWHDAILTDTELIKAGDIITFMYDGTQYQIISISPVTVSTITVPNITDVGSAPTLGTDITASDITAWTTNTPTEVTKQTVVKSTTATTISVSSETLAIPASVITARTTGDSVTVTAGTAASLTYDPKTIPNVTDVGAAPTLGSSITVIDSIKS